MLRTINNVEFASWFNHFPIICLVIINSVLQIEQWGIAEVASGIW